MDQILFSSPGTPESWYNEDSGDVIEFATPEDAKKAEALFNRIQAAAKPNADALALLRELNDALVIPGCLQPRVDAVLDRAEEKS